MTVRHIVLLLALAVPRLAFAGVITVDTGADEDVTAAACSSDTTCSLRAAVQAFNSQADACGCKYNGQPVTIVMNPSLAPTVTLSVAGAAENDNATGDLDIEAGNGDLTIQSATATQVTIDASGLGDRAFDIHNKVTLAIPAAAYNVTFQSLLIQGGSPPSPTSDCGNAVSDGGAVRVDFATIGGLGACPAVGSGNADTVVFTSCSLAGNSAANGGAIATQGARATLNATTLSGNTASAAGGGIYVINDPANVGLLAVQKSSIITNNTASGDGGGIFISSSNETVSGIDCTATGLGTMTMALCVSSSIVTDNSTTGNGGGIAMSGGDAILDAANVNGANHADGNGGGIYATKGMLSVQRASAINGNNADGSGGGIYMASANAPANAAADCAGVQALCVNGSDVSDNQANNGNGGGINLASPSSQTVNILASSAATPVASTIGRSGNRNKAKQGGGGIYAGGTCTSDCAVNLTGSSVSFNDAQNADGGGIDSQNFVLTLTGSTIASNTAKGNGAGIAHFTKGTSLTTSGVNKFLNNTAQGDGGGLYTACLAPCNQKQTVTLTNVHLGESGSGNTASEGGGWYIDTNADNSAAELKGTSKVTSNVATGAGGGIAIDHASSPGTNSPQVTIAADFTGNSASGDGGGMYNASVGTHTLVSGGTFASNSAANGGAIANHQDGSSFNMPGGDPCAGASISTQNVLTVCNATIGAQGTPNHANVNGGGIRSESSIFVGDSTITQNTATANGGGLSNGAASSFYLLRSSVNANHATDGGGIFSLGDMLLVADQVSSNIATDSGGGVANESTLANKLVGILYSTIASNSAAAGGGIVTLSGNTRLNNVTVASNSVTTTGNGGGINSGGSTTQIDNSIVNLNTDGGGTSPDCVGSPTSGQNIYGSGSSTCINGAGGDTTDNLNATLHLITPLANYGGPTLVDALGPGSSAVNAGLNGGPNACGKLNTPGATAGWLAGTADNTDQRGVPVPQPQAGPNAKCDIGAYEATPDLQANARANACPALVAGGSAQTFATQIDNDTSGVPAGADVANAIVVTFTLPAHVIFESITPPATGTWACASPAAATVGPLSFACTLTSAGLAAAAFPLNFSLSLALDPSATPAMTTIYSVSVSDETADSNSADNADSQSCTTTASVSLQLSKSDSLATISAGSAPVYTIAIANTGPSTAVAVPVADALPPGVLSAAWTCSASAGSSCPASGTDAINATVTIAPGGSVTFTDTAQTDFGLANGSNVTNQADVTVPAIYAGGCSSTNLTACPANGGGVCHACDKDSVTAAVSELGITKSAPITIGQGATYTQTTTLIVAGPSSSQNIVVTDVGGSAAATIVSYTLDAAASAKFTCTGVPAVGNTGAFTVTCTSSGILAVGSYVFTTTSTIVDDGSSPAPIAYSATLTHLGVPNQLDPGDPQQLPDSASGTTAIDIESDVAIAINAQSTINAGEALSEAITVTDLGPSTARGVSFSVTNTSFVSFDAPALWSCILPAAGASGTVSCSAGTLRPADGPQMFTLVTRVDPAAAFGTVITATAILGTLASDPHLENNGPVSASTTVGNAADLSVTLTASPSEVAPSGTVDYAIDLQNNGPSTEAAVTLTLQLPPDASYKSLSLAGFTCGAPSAAGLVTCTATSVAAGASQTGTLSVTVSTQAPNGEVLTTTAHVSSSGSNPLPANDTATALVTVNTAAGGNGPVTFGTVTVSHDQVKERGGVFRCDSMHGSGASDLAALIAAAFIATRIGRRRRR